MQDEALKRFKRYYKIMIDKGVTASLIPDKMQKQYNKKFFIVNNSLYCEDDENIKFVRKL